MKELVTQKIIEQKIFVIRGKKVIIDRDLAELYGVETKYLNRQVRRNIERFPEEFMFQLTEDEKKELVTNWHQFKNLKHSTSPPYAFTEHGVAMLASVLNSETAVRVSIYVINAFVRLRELATHYSDLAQKLTRLEEKVGKHDEEITGLIQAMRDLMSVPEKPKRRIGFHAKY